MKNRVIFYIGVFLLLLFVLAMSPLALCAQVPQNIQKLSGALTQSFTVPSGVSIAATGTGTISATSVTGFSPASGKVLTLSNSMTLTATDGSTVAFGTGGTVAYTGSSVASIAGTTNQISTSSSTGAVTLSLAGPHNFTTLTSTAVLLGGGTSAINASDMTYATPTLTVPNAFALTSAGSIDLVGGGSNQNVTVRPSGTGYAYFYKTNGSPQIYLGTSSSITQSASLDFRSTGDNSLNIFTNYTGGTTNQINMFPGAVRNTQFMQSGSVLIGTTLDNSSRVTIARTASTTTTVATGYLSIGGNEALVNSYRLIWFGFNNPGVPTTYAPGYFGYQEMANNSSTNGDFVWGLRSVQTDTLPSEYMRLKASGLLIVNGVNTLPTATSGATFQFSSFGLIDGVATSPFMTFRRTNTSAASPSAVILNNNIGRISGTGWDGTATYRQSADLIFNASENWSSSAAGGEIQFRTQINGGVGGTSTRLLIGNYGALTHTPASASLSSWTTTGALESHATATMTDSSTAGSGTAASAVFYSFAAPTLAATNSSVTTTNAATVYIAGAPAAGTNQTLTSSWGFWNDGKLRQTASSQFESSVTLALGARFVINTDSESVGDLGNTGYMMQLRSKSVTNTSSSGTVAVNTAFSLGIPTLLANSATTYTDATVWYSDGAPTASTNVTITRKHSILVQDGTTPTDSITGAMVISSTIGSTTGSTAIGGGKINTSSTIVTASTITTLGGATFHTTSSALTDGAGVLVATFTNSPVTGNPTKWIGINDNGTTRYIPAF